MQDLKRVLQKFDPKEDDISLYLVMVERQAKRLGIDFSDLVHYLHPLFPSDINKIIAREPEDKMNDYHHIKGLLLKKFKLSPEKFRQKFFQTQRRPKVEWKEFVFELRNFLDEWIEGLEVRDFEQLKDLLVTEQMKSRVNDEVKGHFIDEWAEFKSAAVLAEKLDNYETVRSVMKRPVQLGGQDRRKIETEDGTESLDWRSGTPNEVENGRRPNEGFDRRKAPKCYSCGQSGHLKPQCPRLKRERPVATVNSLWERSTEGLLNPYITEALVNGHKLPVLRDTGATIDLICRKYVTPAMLTGEYVWVQQPLEPDVVRLPLAEVVLSGKFGRVKTKAAVVREGLYKGRYILGNETAQRLKEHGGNGFDIEKAWTVQTRNSDLDKLQEELRKTRSVADKLTTYVDKCTKLQDELKGASLEIRELRLELTKSHEDVSSVRKMWEEAQNQLQDAEATAKRLDGELKATELEKEKLKADVEMFHLADMENKYAAQRGELKEMKNLFVQTLSQLKNLQAEVQKLQGRNSNLHADRTASHSSIIGDELGNREEKLLNAETENKNIQTELSRACNDA